MFSTVPAGPLDQAFLFELYATTRRDELAAWGWEPAQQDAFLRIQFMAQQQSYEWQYPGMDHQLILVEGRKAGRIIVWRSENGIRLVDVTLLPEYQGRGIGTSLLRGLQGEAVQAGNPLTLSLLKTNTGARRLYEQLGFTEADDHDPYRTMVWHG